ncbi:MAG: response regulator [Gomphosphaeria aponina SAG 52.96 = DSM 107014]|uniref:histidine kinase n=1 Tax=Gomphosphaeria aponina SAG 52.96 = DSM 107014 TaxID=1521640 RepID=A0A941JT04_9CHRO|nr:response regulator [Gomphosphaeria aponina SAG 52.96 = DSM 107014]
MNNEQEFEAQLQQELRQMFDLDSQKYLERYLNLAQQLNNQSWTGDIQELYRSIHTIKGGAVTVGSDAILYVAIALEDLLSDLRYLNPAPPLQDGKLSQMLLEAGELLASSVQVQAVGEEAKKIVKPTVEAIVNLREKIHQLYLPEWSEQKQLYEEFATQGFDLVVLDLEMALEKMSATVTSENLAIGKNTLAQLREIGRDLGFATEWTEKINRCEEILKQQESEYWVATWPIYLQELKECARNGGKILPKVSATENPGINNNGENWDNLTEIDSETLLDLEELFTEKEEELVEENADEIEPRIIVQHQVGTETEGDIQIPVPLRRLDQTATHLVESLLAARASQGLYTSLQSMLTRLFTLAQENGQYITSLRQIQDDYALLNNLNNAGENSSDGLNLERYRQGYTSINRLLENSLRLSELGEEAAKVAIATRSSLQSLERNILSLQQTVEENRLVPFKNLGFRARAIIRDLQTRYGHPASLIVKGEQIELDAGTSCLLEPALLHLLRNAYDHGLELPHERKLLGKPEEGQITLSLRRRGSNLLFEIKDDGRGINAQKIAQIAKTKGLPLTKTDNLAELLEVICQPGFSSQSQVSNVSGRGVGMDVVVNQVRKLGGKLTLETTPGSGTTFQLQLRVPHLLVPCVLLKAGIGAGFSPGRSEFSPQNLHLTKPALTFAIPVQDIVTTTLFGSLNTQKAKAGHLYSQVVQEGTRWIPALDLLEYWEGESLSRQFSELAVCVYVHFQGGGAWLLADELLGQTDLLIEPLPSPLVTPAGLMGVSLQVDGTLIPVLEATSIVEFCSQTADNTPEISENTLTEQKVIQTDDLRERLNQSILVVDDAALMRRRIEASLAAYGYIIYTCADGQEAWNWLQTNPTPALVITDIEMPRLDGFTLIDRCRQSGINIPMLVISSRLSEEWGKEARRVGATDYLTKGFSTPELINKVKTLLESRDGSGEWGVGSRE